MALSSVKPYFIPLTLLAAAIAFQLIILPASFPTSHYDVLGISRNSSIEEVKQAYGKLYSKWKSGGDVRSAVEFVKIQYASELLTNPLWKRDYDIYNIEEQIHVLEDAKAKYGDKSFVDINLPLLSPLSTNDYAFNVITAKDFGSKFQANQPWIVQVHSYGSKRCSEFLDNWKEITSLLNGIANNGMIELGELELVTYLAEKKFTGHAFFRSGVPSLIAFPAGCRSPQCLVRYGGQLSVDAVTDWFTTEILGLPQIFYYPKETLGQGFIAKSGAHKVKFIFFSETGERATPYLRQIAKDYWDSVSFAFVLWKKEDFSIWWTSFGVESAPALVVLKDPGVKPIVYQGPLDRSALLTIIKENKNQELLQLRTSTYKELGCDPRGYSRAGYDSKIWYCVIVAGRQSKELNKMRETLRRVQEMVSNEANEGNTSAAVARKEKRMAFAWLDGDAQQDYCIYYLGPDSYATCGKRSVEEDTPRLFIVRYGRNDSDEKSTTRKPNVWQAMQEEMDPVSQLVAKYNGSDDSSEIIKWISEIVEAGDSDQLPFFKTQTPALVPEEADPLPVPRKSSSIGVKQKVSNIMFHVIEDPRVGPVLFLAALISFGSIWLRGTKETTSSGFSSGQPAPLADNTTSNPTSAQATVRETKRNLTRRKGKQGQAPPSITDAEPKDAVQMPLSDSDS